MKNAIYLFLFLCSNLSLTSPKPQEEKIVSYTANPKNENIRMYWKDSLNQNISSLGNLKKLLATKKETLLFAMNGGMYLKDRSPQGLYIENGIQFKKVNKLKEAYGNFYLQPNGLFFIDENKLATVQKTTDYKGNKNILYATQSGPMLVIDGKIHDKFTKGSKNVHIRNGVGILKNGDIFFAMSKEKINLYDFANYFRSKGCENALYLDGFVSRTYCPSEKWEQLDGNFGVLIGVSEGFK